MRFKQLVMGLGLLGATGCYTTKLVFNKQTMVSPVDSGGDIDKWHHDGVFGLVEFSPAVDVVALCPQGVSFIEQETSFINGLLGNLTRGLYTPQTVTVYCVDGRIGEAALQEDGRVIGYVALPQPVSGR